MRLYRGQKITQMFIDRQAAEEQLNIMDKSQWYIPNSSHIDEDMWAKFHLSFLDTDSQNFLEESARVSGSCCLQAWYSFMTVILSTFISKTSINGVLNRGGMFLFSSNQLREFAQVPEDWSRTGKKVLDLGAGDGGITKVYFDLFEEVYATEMSKVMQFRLMMKGASIVDVENWANDDRRYDLISVLNLLDRHYNPRKLLADLHKVALRSNCPVLMAVVLPVRQYVEFHPTTKTTQPDVHLGLHGRSYEDHVNSIVKDEFVPAGFELIRWTKLPYLCEGDFNKPYYILYDAVFLLRAIPTQNHGDFLTNNEVVHEEL